MTKIHIYSYGGVLRSPDFHTVTPQEFLANKNSLGRHPLSLVLPWQIKWPNQPDWNKYPKALVEQPLLFRPRPDRSLLLQIDDRLWRDFLVESRLRAGKRYVERWHQQDYESQRQFEELSEREAYYWRAKLWTRVKHLVVSDLKAHRKAAKLQLELFDLIERYAKHHGLHDVLETKHLIKEGFKRHEAYWAWRLDNLYARFGKSGFAKLKGHGHMLEMVLGDIIWDVRRTVTSGHHEWRLDTNYMIGANGGVVKIKHSNGQPMEFVAAKAHEPLLHDRRERAERWHDLAFETPTANGALRPFKRGEQPAEAIAKMMEPLAEQRDRKTLLWHLTHLLQTAPNGGFRPASSAFHGQAPELVTADFLWRHRRDASHKAAQWHLEHQFEPLANGGFVPVKIHAGKSWERVSYETSEPKRRQQTKHFNDWHASHLFQETPNHGMAPRKGVGQSYEDVSQKVAERPKDAATAAFHLWHMTHRFKETSNHTFAPQKGTGLTLEFVSAETIKQVKDAITRRTLLWRLNDRVVPTENGGMRKLAHVTQSSVGAAAEVQPPDEGPGAVAPLPSKGGDILAAVENRLGLQRDFQLRRSQLEWSRSLAAHESQVSLLRGHIIDAASGQKGLESSAHVADAAKATAQAKKS